jgi:hypothetical protein
MLLRRFRSLKQHHHLQPSCTLIPSSSSPCMLHSKRANFRVAQKLFKQHNAATSLLNLPAVARPSHAAGLTATHLMAM